VKDITLPALILAVGVVLDFLTVRHRPAIFEGFYQWWFKLSAMNFNTVGERGVCWFSRNVIDRVFGSKVLTIRSLLLGSLFVFGSMLAVNSLPNLAAGSASNLAATVLIFAGALLPGILNFVGARLLIHILCRRVTFMRVLLFGLASFVVAEFTVVIGYLSLGLLTAVLVKLGYSHHLALVDAVPVSAILLLVSLGLILVYLPTAILPAICCLLIWIIFVLLYASSAFALWVRHFLADRIEQKWEAPFTAIGAIIAAFATIAIWTSTLVNAFQVTQIAAQTQRNCDAKLAYLGSSLGTSIAIESSNNKQQVAKYYNDWAEGLRGFFRNGIPTPVQVGELLRLHLPNLARQWNSPTGEEQNGRR
jgi:hypothetical protein